MGRLGSRRADAAIASFYWKKSRPDFPGGYYTNIISGTSSGIGNPRFAYNLLGFGPGVGPELKREIRETYPGLVLLDSLNAMIPSPG